MKNIMVGGQAVIEGVMFKSPHHITIAVRKPDGSIKIKEEKFISLTEKHKILGLPFIRGVIVLFETLRIGMKAITYSADESAGEGEEEEKLGWWGYTLSILFSIVLALFIFKFLPLLLVQSLGRVSTLFQNNFVFNFVEGLTKIILFVLYVYLISFMKDIKLLFEYHGAEHQVINAYENNKKITIKNVKKYGTIHSRCGTSFIFLVLFISILVYMLIPMNYSFLMKYGLRILLLPVIAGISYELLKLTAKYEKSPFFRLFILPGRWIQKITTSKPNTKQLEVSMASLERILKLEKAYKSKTQSF